MLQCPLSQAKFWNTWHNLHLINPNSDFPATVFVWPPPSTSFMLESHCCLPLWSLSVARDVWIAGSSRKPWHLLIHSTNIFEYQLFQFQTLPRWKTNFLTLETMYQFWWWRYIVNGYTNRYILMDSPSQLLRRLPSLEGWTKIFRLIICWAEISEDTCLFMRGSVLFLSLHFTEG